MGKIVEEWLFRPEKGELRDGVTAGFQAMDTGAQQKMREVLLRLSQRLGEIAWERGYMPDPHSIEPLLDRSDFGKRVGIGLFLTGEKYDDARSLVYSVLKDTERMAGDLAAFRNEVIALEDIIHSLSQQAIMDGLTEAQKERVDQIARARAMEDDEEG